MSGSIKSKISVPTSQSLISVIIPTFNRVQYLEDAIASVLNQDYTPVELIVVDDGSTDATPSVVRGMGGNIRYVYQDNMGIAGARNTGVSLATGAFLAFLDSDDVWMPGKLTRQMAVFAARPETDVVYGHAEQFFSPEIEPEFRQRLKTGEGILPAPLPTSMLIRRAAFDHVGPFDPQYPVGTEIGWQARLQECDLTVTMMPDVVYRRRLHRSNFSLTHADASGDRLRALKAIIDRRRLAQSASATGDANV